jgi:3-dehydroquinate synthase
MKTLHVDLGSRSYPVVVGEGLLKCAGRLLSGLGLTSSPMVVTNSTVWRLHGSALQYSLGDLWNPALVLSIGDGEQYKNHATLQRIYERLFRARADRRSWILAFGGGVVGDVAGFAAATFMRGIPYVSIPTTLLSQVDSSIGGKVGINVPQGKNLIGAFHQPSAVLSDTSVLRTLPRRELSAGLYEVLKCGAIRSEPLLSYLERRLAAILDCRPAALEHIVVAASRIKAEVVSRDEREQELRMVLNYGHTVGHALEAVTAYRRFKHGEAVAWGMIAALQFGRALGLADREETERLVRLIRRVAPLPPLGGIELTPLWNALRRDKKFRAGDIRMVLLPRLGRAKIVADIDPSSLRLFLKKFLTQEAKAVS